MAVPRDTTGLKVLTGTAAAAGQNGTDQANLNAKGLVVVVDITAISGVGADLVVTVQGKDPHSGKYYTILASAALTAVATTVLRIYPGMAAVANTRADDAIPATWRIITAITGTTPAVTYTVGAITIP